MTSSGPATVPPPTTTPVQDPAKAAADKAAAEKAAADAKAATTPAPNPDANAVKFSDHIMNAWTSLGTTLQFLIGMLTFVLVFIFSYGAAKISWSVNQSVIWAVVDFLFSAFYYPYYAYAQLPQPGLMGVLGARRRR